MDDSPDFSDTIGMPLEGIAKQDPGEIGKTGLHNFGGFISEEFLTQLQFHKGQKIWREMRDNDPTVGAMMQAVEALVREVSWDIIPSDMNDRDSKDAAMWLKSNIEEMDHTWEDYLSEVMSMFTFGWQWSEIVMKKRDDGTIGIKKLAPRAQESLQRWEMDDCGTLLGLWQLPPTGGETVLIPLSKSIHFRTTSIKQNPEGRSMLRNAFRPWSFMKRAEEYEAIGIERELAGLPIVRIPKEYLNTNDANFTAIREEYRKIARDLKFNEQGAIIIPSDTYKDKEGNPTAIRMVEIELMSSSGSRAIDTNTIILRYQQTIARTILADFLVLGSNSRGSFSLSKDKSMLFMKALQSQVNGIASTLNRQLIPKLWEINNFDKRIKPKFVPGKVQPADLKELGDYISRLAGAGFMMAGDEEIENTLLAVANLPHSGTLDGN